MRSGVSRPLPRNCGSRVHCSMIVSTGWSAAITPTSDYWLPTIFVSAVNMGALRPAASSAAAAWPASTARRHLAVSRQPCGRWYRGPSVPPAPRSSRQSTGWTVSTISAAPRTAITSTAATSLCSLIISSISPSSSISRSAFATPASARISMPNSAMTTPSAPPTRRR